MSTCPYKKEHATYLMALRDSGVINMLGAGPYLQRDFGLSRYEAKGILDKWRLNKPFDELPARTIKLRGTSNGQ